MREEREKNNLLKSIERLQNEKRQPVFFSLQKKTEILKQGLKTSKLNYWQ